LATSSKKKARATRAPLQAKPSSGNKGKGAKRSKKAAPAGRPKAASNPAGRPKRASKGKPAAKATRGKPAAKATKGKPARKTTKPAATKGTAARGKAKRAGAAKGRGSGGAIVGGAAAERPVRPSKAASRRRPSGRGSPGGHRRTTDKSANQRGALTTSLDPPKAPGEKRNFGLRGAAPWVARHAAKHAEELRRRNAQPPPPGSARATLRVPEEAEQIKADVARLHQITSRIRQLCRRLDRNFYEVGELLADIQQQELHLAKGFASFEAFLDRETDLGRANALRLIRIAHTFFRETAYDYGIDRLTAALAALDGDIAPGSPSQPSSSSFSSPALPAKAPIRFNE
jgi:hypothetical protein